MFQKLLVAAAVFAVGTMAQAQSDMQSEHFYQTKAGQSDLSVGLGYRSLTTKAEGATDDHTVTGLNALLGYEYGLNDMLSLGAYINYTNYEMDVAGPTKPKDSGVSNPKVVLKGTSDNSSYRLRYGSAFGLGLQKQKIEINLDRNGVDDGFFIAPYIGVDSTMGAGILGARLAYTYNLERDVEVGGTDMTVKGGNQMAVTAFYEYFVTDMLLGADVHYVSADALKDKSDDSDAIDSYNMTGIALYSRIPMGGWELLPKVNYDFSRTKTDKFGDLGLSVAARFNF